MTLLLLVGAPIALLLFLCYWLWIISARRKRFDKAAAIMAKEGRAMPYFFYRRQVKEDVSGIGIHISLPFKFRCERFSFLDRVAAMLGFATPMSTGDITFDRKVFTYSNNPNFYAALGASGTLRTLILEIQASGFDVVSAESGSLVMSSRRFAKLFKRHDSVEEKASTFAAKLQSCVDYLRNVPAEEHDKSLIIAEKRDRKIKAIFAAAALLSGAFAVFACTDAIYIMPHVIPVWDMALRYSPALVIFGFLTLHCLMSGSPYGADTFKSFVKIGIVSTLLITFDVIYFTDIELDTAAPSHHNQHIVGKRRSSGRHTSYFLSFENWKSATPIEINVGYGLYNHFNPGEQLLLLSHPGFFNIEWISIP